MARHARGTFLTSDLGKAFIVVAATIGLSQTAQAETIRYSGVGVNLGCGSAAECNYLGLADQVVTESFGGAPIVMGQTTFGAGTARLLVAAGDAESSFGVLHATARAGYNIQPIVDGTNPPDSRFTVALAQFADLLTISSPLLDGTPGQLFVSYQLDGVIEEVGGGKAFAQVVLETGVDSPFEQVVGAHAYTSSTSGTFSFSAPINFIYGESFYLTFSLGAVGGTAQFCSGCPSGVDFGETTGSGVGRALFGNTLVVSGLVPTVQIGGVAVPVLDATFASESLTSYSIDGVVTPEPGSLMLLGSGLAAASYRLRRRRRSAPDA